MKKFAIILSGCGVYDGSEIHESTMAMLAIKKHGCDYELFAPEKMQYDVINHLTGQPSDENRNVLVEAARIGRGEVKDLKNLKASDFDILLIPGGFGAAKNLSTYAIDGANMQVDKELERVILEFNNAKKPIGAMCIAPVIIAKVIPGVLVTIGQDLKTAEDIKALGANHKNTNKAEIAIDEKNKVATTPCYMLSSTIADIYDGA
ncbi:MAG: isoprenoid biosynthesis glyoxalase ElbB, partial [Bacteroidales bacterium]